MDFVVCSAEKTASSGIQALPKAKARHEIGPTSRTVERTTGRDAGAPGRGSECPRIIRISPTLRHDDVAVLLCGSFAEITSVFNIFVTGFRQNRQSLPNWFKPCICHNRFCVAECC